MTEHFADKLLQAIETKGSPVCIGLDPVYSRLPDTFHWANATDQQQVELIEKFCLEVLEVVAPIVPAVKPQSAYFEIYHARGVEAYFNVVRAAKDMGLIVIGDAKRGDIGSTASAYAEGHLTSPNTPNALTVNAYFGGDGLSPFIDTARDHGRGVFALVRTSNPSAANIQDFADPSGKKFYQHIAEQIARLGAAEGLIGQSGYSCLGAVVGATYPDEARQLREIMPQQIFLVPGYGAQGATAADCAASFKADGTGAIVNASRSVIYAFSKENADADWKTAIKSAAKAFAADIAGVLSK